MCIRDRIEDGPYKEQIAKTASNISNHDSWPLLLDTLQGTCLLYTSDAADDLLCVDLGGRRIIKKTTLVYQAYISCLISHPINLKAQLIHLYVIL